MKDEHVRDEHVKDAAQDVAENVTQDVAQDVLGAAEDGSSSVSGGKAIITPVAYPQLPPTPTPPRHLHQRFLHRFCQRRKDYHHTRGLPPTAPHPHTPQGFFINGTPHTRP